MREIPILFSTEMVRALLAGRKTMTRRIMNPQPLKADIAKVPTNGWDSVLPMCPYGKPGDLIWVRESTLKERQKGNTLNPAFGKYIYRADLKVGEFEPGTTLYSYNDIAPSIHMPKAAARIWLQVEEVRIERVNEISDDDILREGVLIPVSNKSGANNSVMFLLGEKNKAIHFIPEGSFAKGAPQLTQHQLLFAFWAELWCNVNGRESWEDNPYVWAVKFKVVSTTGRYHFKPIPTADNELMEATTWPRFPPKQPAYIRKEVHHA